VVDNRSLNSPKWYSGIIFHCIGRHNSMYRRGLCYSSRVSTTPDFDVITGTEFLSENIVALAGNDVVYMHLEARIT
jgi:hypothetical protein